MKKLLILRGLPGSGKSTWVKENNLEEYTIATDKLRLLYSAPMLGVNGTFEISQKTNNIIWNLVFSALEYRMQNGDFTVVDATNVKSSNLQKYVNLSKRYGYELYCIDFSDIPIEEIKKRNSNRPALHQVSDTVIDRMAEQMNSGIPYQFHILSPETALNDISEKPKNFSNWDKIIHIGDIHGCFDQLMELLEPMDAKMLYIFCGDYMDRGPKNHETLMKLSELMKMPNIILLRGNHENHLDKWAREENVKSKTFTETTMREFQMYNVNRKFVKTFYKHLRDFVYYTYPINGTMSNVFVSHGGISTLPERMELISSRDLIAGSGTYEETEKVENNFLNTTENTYMIHGHRNINMTKTRSTERTFNLEGGAGKDPNGKIRAVEFSRKGIRCIEK